MQGMSHVQAMSQTHNSIPTGTEKRYSEVFE